MFFHARFFVPLALLSFSLWTDPINSDSLTPSSEQEYQVVILGGGMAGLTASLYLSRAGIIPLVITGPQIGGAITQSYCVENWPGNLKISGNSLAKNVKDQVIANGALLLPNDIVSVDLSANPFTIVSRDITTQKLHTVKAKTCIIALGCTPNTLNIPGESNYIGQGIFFCGNPDRSLYKRKVVGIVGGGDSSLVEALALSKLAKKVYVFVKGSAFKTVEEERKKAVLSLSNVEVLYNTNITEVKGSPSQLTYVCYTENSEPVKELPLDALILAIGARPNSDFFKDSLERDPQGYVTLKHFQETSVKGVYAAGDICDPLFKQAVTAAGEGARAAIQLQEYLSSCNQAPSQK